MPAIQVKNVPEELHEQLRARAETEGLTLSAYLLELIRKDLRTPRFRAWVDELQTLPDLDDLDIDSGELIAEIRAEKAEDDDGQRDRMTARRRSDGGSSGR